MTSSANFQGPFSMHPVMARALKVAGQSAAAFARRPIPAAAFGVKQGLFPLHRPDGPSPRAKSGPTGQMGSRTGLEPSGGVGVPPTNRHDAARSLPSGPGWGASPR